jgi:hypothetical protein
MDSKFSLPPPCDFYGGDCLATGVEMESGREKIASFPSSRLDGGEMPQMRR